MKWPRWKCRAGIVRGRASGGLHTRPIGDRDDQRVGQAPFDGGYLRHSLTAPTTIVSMCFIRDAAERVGGA